MSNKKKKKKIGPRVFLRWHVSCNVIESRSLMQFIKFWSMFRSFASAQENRIQSKKKNMYISRHNWNSIRGDYVHTYAIRDCPFLENGATANECFHVMDRWFYVGWYFIKRRISLKSETNKFYSLGSPFLRSKSNVEIKILLPAATDFARKVLLDRLHCR